MGIREASLILPVPLPLPFPQLASTPSLATIMLLLYLPLEGKTKGLGEVTRIMGERERKSEKGRREGREGKERATERGKTCVLGSSQREREGKDGKGKGEG